MRIYSVSSYPQNTVKRSSTPSFGLQHPLDVTKKAWEDALKTWDDAIASKEKEITNEKNDHEKACKKYNSSITNLKTNSTGLIENIDTLQKNINELQDQIDDAKETGETLKKEFDANQSKIVKLSKEKATAIKALAAETDASITYKNNEIAAQDKSIQDVYMQNWSEILSGPKNQIICNIINPIINPTGKIKPPKFISMKEADNNVAIKVFEWIVKETNSDYAIIDAKNIDIKGLKAILQYVQKKKEENPTKKAKTLIFITNTKSLPSDKNFLTHFKSILDNDSMLFVNSNNDLNADYKIDLSLAFVTNPRVGLNSIIIRNSNLKLTGTNYYFNDFNEG